MTGTPYTDGENTGPPFVPPIEESPRDDDDDDPRNADGGRAEAVGPYLYGAVRDSTDVAF